jgi:hypothetical protein
LQAPCYNRIKSSFEIGGHLPEHVFKKLYEERTDKIEKSIKEIKPSILCLQVNRLTKALPAGTVV